MWRQTTSRSRSDLLHAVFGVLLSIFLILHPALFPVAQAQQDGGDTLRLAAEVASLRDTLAQREQRLKDLEDEQLMLQALGDKQTQIRLQDSIDALEAQARELDEQIAQVEQQLDALQNRTIEGHSRIGQLERTPSLRAQRAYEEAKALLDLPFEQMAADSISRLMASLQEFEAQDDYAAFRTRAEHRARGKEVYDRGWKALNAPYDGEDVPEAYGEARREKASEQLTDGQREEMASLCVALSRYHWGIIYLQQLVHSVNANATVRQARRDGDAGTCERAIKRVLDTFKNDQNEDYQLMQEKYFHWVPNLEALWTRYMQAIAADPLTRADVEQEILNFRTQ